MELQACEAIYGDDYKKLDEPPNAFEVTLVPEAGAGDDVNHICVALRVIYTPTYPEAAPELSVRAVRRGGLTDEGLAECETLLREAASSDELLGTAMVYMLVEKCIEWMVEHNKPEMDMHTEMMQRLKAQEAERGGAVDVSDGADGGGGASSSKLRDLHKKTAGKGGPEGTWRAEAAVDAEGRPTTFTAELGAKKLTDQPAAGGSIVYHNKLTQGIEALRESFGQPESFILGRRIFSLNCEKICGRTLGGWALNSRF